jgi:hypothetical protein
MSQQIQLRRGTASQWTAANPTLAEGEIGIETDTGLYKVGNGVNNWAARPYSTLRNIDTGTIINMTGQATPAAPASNSLNLFAKDLGGRMMLRQQGPSGISTPLQPSFFQNNIVMINTSASTSVGVIGNSVTSVGTISYPTITQQYGYMANFVSAATAAATAGTGNSAVLWQRGDASGSNGFFFNARLGFSDASYNESGASTGTRVFVGLTNQTLAASVASDNPAGHYCGFFRRSVNGGATDTNWQFATKNNVTLSLTNTGLVFSAEKVYDFYIFCPPQGSEIFWRIDNVTDGTTAEGSTTTNIPGATVFMRAGFQLLTVDAVARNIRMQRVYTESDR